MADRVRVLVWHRADGREEELQDLYHRISERMAATPGLLRNELWRRSAGEYVVMSEWESLADFHRWADDPEQHKATWPLREYRAEGDRQAELYQVVAAH